MILKRLPIRGAAAAGLVVCAMSGAAWHAYRMAYAVPSAVQKWEGFQNAAVPAGGEPVHEARSYASIACTVPDWRPLRLRVRLRAPQASGGQTIRVPLESDHAPLGTAQVTGTWAAYEFAIDTPPSPMRHLTLHVTADAEGPGRAGIQVGEVSLTPMATPFAVLRYGVTGAVLGALAFMLFLPLRASAPVETARRGEGQAARGMPTVAVASALLAYFIVWGFIKPPLQAPDEPQHLMRAAAILHTPWLARDGTFPHDPRFLNPLALWHPRSLWKVIYPRAETMTREDVAELKKAPWKPESELQQLEPYRIALASYPTLYYWCVFAGGQLVTSLASLSPYASVYAYRVASLLVATGLWMLVYRDLRELFDDRDPGTGAVAPLMLAFIVLNPMVGYLTSSVNADAFAIPLATLTILACWRTLSRGTGAWRTTTWALLGALVKPSGLQVIVALAAVTVLLALARQVDRRHALLALMSVGRAVVPAWLLFYAWSPTIFVGDGVSLDVPTYILRFVQRLPEFWVYFWGMLGWRDYKLPDVWYAVLAGVLLINAMCLWWRPGPFRGFSAFALLVFLAFAITSAAGEYVYLREAGFILIGRYFLPALAGLTPLLLHRVRPARVALIVCLVSMNVLLMQATIARCYGGDYVTLWHALPFVP